MGKKVKASKADKNKAPPINWRQKLAELNINTVYENRTCDVILLIESTDIFYEVTTRFAAGSQLRPMATCKIIRNVDILEDICDPESSESSGELATILYKMARTEAANYVNRSDHIPLELLSKLIKLKIINVLNADIKLMEPQDVPNNTESQKKKNRKIGKVPIVENEKRSSRFSCLENNNGIKEAKHLHILLGGFYEYKLIKYLFKIDVTLSAIVEITGVDDISEEDLRIPERASVIDTASTMRTSREGKPIRRSTAERACQVPVTFTSFSSQLVPIYVSTKAETEIQGLTEFWNELHSFLDGTIKSKYLVNTAHMQIPRTFEINLEVYNDYEEQCIKTFEAIADEIQKIATLQEEHKSYIKSLKIDDLRYKPKVKLAENFKTYKLLSDEIPPECFSVELILNCLVDEVHSRVSMKPREKSVSIFSNASILKNVKPSESAPKPVENEDSVIEIQEASRNPHSKRKTKIKSTKEIWRWLRRCVLTISPNHLPAIVSYEYPNLLPKTRLRVEESSFEIHKTNEIYHKAYCYPEISNRLINLQLNMLKVCSPASIFPRYKPLSFGSSLLIKNQVQTWAKAVNKSEEETLYHISAIAFETLTCEFKNLSLLPNKTPLQLSFPEKSYHQEENAVITQLKYINAPAKTPIIENIIQTLPILRYSINENVYETKNFRGHQWFEKLDRSELLQLLKKIRKSYICLDHRYCPFNDSILLRYHNRTDLFGINSIIWRKYIYSPVGFKDFCKYVFQQKNYDKCFGSTAYNISNDRVQLHGTTTVFHSIDGCKVIAEQTNFIGRSKNLTVSICVDSNYLVLHCNKTSPKKPFYFHLNLEDGTIIVLKKVSQLRKSGFKVVERLNQKPQSPTRKPVLYKVREHVGRRLLESQNPTVVTKPRALTRTELQKFIKECTCWFDNPIHCMLCQNLFGTSDRMEGEIYRKEKERVLLEKYEEEFNDLEMYRSKRRSLQKRAYTKITNIPSDIESGEDDYCRKRIRIPKPKTCPLVLFKFNRSILNLKEILERINLAKKCQIPLFKVCSSGLHKFSYMVPCKSTITIEIDDQVIKILCSHPRRKIKTEVKVIKVEPCGLPQYDLNFSHWYDMSLSLPTGLLIYTMPSLDEGPFNVKQEYLDKGPACQSVLNERSRSFTRDGKIVIKKLDGTIEIIGNGGISMHCDLPYQSTSFRAKNKVKETLRKCTLNINQCILTKRQKLINYIVRTTARHVVGSNANRRFKKSRLQMHFNRIRQFRDYLDEDFSAAKPMYYVRENEKQFSYISTDGTKITFTDKASDDNAIRSKHDDEFHEIFYEKADGVKCILNDDGQLITEFPNGSRITTTCDAMPIEEFDDCLIEDKTANGDNIWILIRMTYKFEHSNYATIFFDNMDFHTEIILQNNVNISISERGEYDISVKENYMRVHVNRDSIKYYSTNCDKCKQNFNALINVAPLFYQLEYNKKEYEILRAYDTYDKMFSVFADGKCFKNCNFIKTRANKFKCLRHDQFENQQLIVLRRDLTGYKLWESKAIRKLLDASETNPLVSVSEEHDKPMFQGADCNYKSLKFKTQIDAANFRLFNTIIDNPQFQLTKYQTKLFQFEQHLAVIKINFVQKPLKMLQFYKSISEACGKVDTWPFNQNNFIEYIENLLIESKQTLEETSNIDEVTPEYLKTNFEAALALCQRWYSWHKYYSLYTCACSIHDDGPLPSSAEVNSDYTISSQEPLHGSASTNLIKKNQTHESKKKADMLENKSIGLEDTFSITDEDFYKFICQKNPIGKPISQDNINTFATIAAAKNTHSAKKSRKNSRRPESRNDEYNRLLTCREIETGKNEIKKKSKATEAFALGMQEYLEEIAETKEILRKKLVALTKTLPDDLSVDHASLNDQNSYQVTVNSSGKLQDDYNVTAILKSVMHLDDGNLLPTNDKKNSACTKTTRHDKAQQTLRNYYNTPKCPKLCQSSQRCPVMRAFRKNLAGFIDERKEVEILYKNSNNTFVSSEAGRKFPSTNSLHNPQKCKIYSMTANSHLNSQATKSTTSDFKQTPTASTNSLPFSQNLGSCCSTTPNSYINSQKTRSTSSKQTITTSTKSFLVAPKPTRSRSVQKKVNLNKK